MEPVSAFSIYGCYVSSSKVQYIPSDYQPKSEMQWITPVIIGIHSFNGYQFWNQRMIASLIGRSFMQAKAEKEGNDGQTLIICLGKKKWMHPDHNATPGATDEGPVTVIVRRKAKQGRTQEFEEWMDGITHAAMKFEGHMGANIIRPAAGSDNPEYVIIFRFDSYSHLAQWENSEIRNQWLRNGVIVTEGEPIVEKQTGLEFWFTPSSGPTAPVLPPRYKMAIVIIGIIFVLVSTILPYIRQATVGLPVLLSTLVGVVIMVLLMTYVIMPLTTRLLKPWLSRKSFL